MPGQTINGLHSAGEEVTLDFQNGTSVSAPCWRLVRKDEVNLSSFDHKENYGLSDAINAPAQLSRAVVHQKVNAASVDESTGDLEFAMADGSRLQVFNFTGYESWEVSFPDGTNMHSSCLEARSNKQQ